MAARWLRRDSPSFCNATLDVMKIEGDYKVSRVRIDAGPVAGGADHATVRVAFRNFGKTAAVTVSFDRTSAG